jgi:hypothetical protein
MFKKLLLPALAFAFALSSASAQHQRRVLLEEFTNASCGPCASQNPTFNATVDANLEFITPIKYQTNWPGFDPMNVQTQTDVAPRVSYYGVDGVPNLQQNGTLDIFPLTGYNAGQIQAAYNTLTPVTITLTHALTADYDSILISVAVKSELPLTGNLRLRVAVIEDEIIFDAAPGSNGEADFYQIMRKMLPNSAGTTTNDFAAGETKNYSFAWPLDYIYDLNEISAAAWLQNDNTKEVWQSARTNPIGGITDAGIRVPSANSFACESGASPVFELINEGDAAVTSAALRYRVGTGNWVDYTWTGNLAAGSSALVTLSDVSITSTGNTAVQVEVLNSNLGIPTNMVEAVATLNIKGIFDAAQTLPFGNTFQSAQYPPAGWSVTNVGTNGWKLATNAGAGSTRSSRCNLYDIAAGNNAYLTTPKVSIPATTGAPSTLTFDHAYTYYDNNLFDSLRVEVSIDCGVTWTTVFHDGYQGLATAPAATGAYTPAASHWQPNEVSLSQFAGNDEVLIRFVAESGFGNNLFIDNVNVTTSVGVKELTLSNFTVQPNPAHDVAQVKFGLEKAQSIQLRVFGADGALVQSQQLGDLVSGDHVATLNANTLPSGSYRVVLQGTEGLAQTQWIVVK